MGPGLRGREQVLPWDGLGLGGGRGRELVSLEVGALPMPFPASLSSHLLFCRDKQLADKLLVIPNHIRAPRHCMASLPLLTSLCLCVSLVWVQVSSSGHHSLVPRLLSRVDLSVP